jgi:hypothetical protein
MPASLDSLTQFVQTGDPTTSHEATPFIGGQLGMVCAMKNSTLFSPGQAPRVYQYIKRSSSDAATIATAGSIAYWKDYDNFVVTSDASDSYDGTGSNHVAGVFPGILVAAGEYGFIQVGGVGPVLLQGSPTAAASTAGLPIVSAGADLTSNCLADWNDQTVDVFAKAITAKNAGSIGTDVCEALLFPRPNGWGV